MGGLLFAWWRYDWDKSSGWEALLKAPSGMRALTAHVETWRSGKEGKQVNAMQTQLPTCGARANPTSQIQAPFHPQVSCSRNASALLVAYKHPLQGRLPC